MKVEQEQIHRTIVRVTEDELVKNFKECYVDIFADADKEDLVQLSKSFYDDCKSLVDRNFRKLCNDGMTMMLLGKNSFPDVDRFFIEKRRAARQNSLSYKMEIMVVVDCGDEMIIIQEENLNY